MNDDYWAKAAREAREAYNTRKEADEITRLRADLAAANTRMSKLDFERTAAELERDALRAELTAVTEEREKFKQILISESNQVGELQLASIDNLAEITRLRADLAAVTAERDALAARLAPVEDEALVDIAIKEVERVIASASDSETVGDARWKALRAAISAIRPHIEAAERERCAKIVELDCDRHSTYAIAAAIRRGENE